MPFNRHKRRSTPSLQNCSVANSVKENAFPAQPGHPAGRSAREDVLLSSTSVCVLTCLMLVGPVMLPDRLSGGADRASAASECGAAIAGTVICNGDGAPATDASPYAGGILYSTQDVKLIVDGTAGALIVQPATSQIAVANRGGAGVATREVQINGDVTIRIQADVFGTPISAVQAYQQQNGNALVIQNGGTIISLGNGAFGVVARTDGTGTATAIQNGGSISTNGTGGAGVALFAEAYGAGSTDRMPSTPWHAAAAVRQRRRRAERSPRCRRPSSMAASSLRRWALGMRAPRRRPALSRPMAPVVP